MECISLREHSVDILHSLLGTAGLNTLIIHFFQIGHQAG